jgi:hypothetical protein
VSRLTNLMQGMILLAVDVTRTQILSQQVLVMRSQEL